MNDELLISFMSFEQPWWVYVLVVLIPLCIFLSLREACCWFFKLNKLVNRIERVEAAILKAIETDPSTERSAPKYEMNSGQETKSGYESKPKATAEAPRKGPSEL